MTSVPAFNPVQQSLVLSRDFRVDLPRELPAPPQQRVPGMAVSVISMERDAPHDGEMHPDGYEVLCLISGRLRVRVGNRTGDLWPRPHIHHRAQNQALPAVDLYYNQQEIQIITKPVLNGPGRLFFQLILRHFITD